MRRFSVVLAGAAVSAGGFCVAATANIAPRVSGEILVEYYLGKPGAKNPALDPNAFVKQQFAKGYLAGVADASQGTGWCATGKVNASELDSQVVQALRRLPPPELGKDAAVLIIDVLRKKFPCP